MAEIKGGWFKQSVRHSNAKRLGRAGGDYSSKQAFATRMAEKPLPVLRDNLEFQKKYGSSTSQLGKENKEVLTTEIDKREKKMNWLTRFGETIKQKEKEYQQHKEEKRTQQMQETRAEIEKLKLEREKAQLEAQKEKELQQLKHEKDVLSGAYEKRQKRRELYGKIGKYALAELKYAFKGDTTHKRKHKRKK